MTELQVRQEEYDWDRHAIGIYRSVSADSRGYQDDLPFHLPYGMRTAGRVAAKIGCLSTSWPRPLGLPDIGCPRA
jgi:hypothetical protein